MKLAVNILAVCLSAGFMASVALASSVNGDPNRGGELAARVCSPCHGMDGNSPVEEFPKLAGIDAYYLLKQLKDFKKKQRESPIMEPFAAALSDKEMADVAVYFGEQKPAPGVVADASLLEAGKLIWQEGNSRSGVPACSGCHGENGEGDEYFPRLAGQHSKYVIAQLTQYREGRRTNDKNRMQAVARRMTQAEIEAATQYIASLQ
ncbi:MAG: cytochrome c, class IC:cytochrome c, class I [Gallionellales bacterium RIFCSPLOWO2_12_FULL_59_22]|nr:MAG: cytochrome c, class IC:cytochrome c, class I [Gallionellales bacterium RIFCSPLOWO2_12_FULL_59_22]